MGKIFCLIGKSGSGKDTIFKRLMKEDELNLKPIILYTTRPIRDNETNGVEYFFINEEQLSEYRKSGKIIELREYNTVEGKWCYCTIDDGQFDLAHNHYLMIVTLEAYKNLKQYFGPEKVFPLYIHVDDDIRLERAIKRERQQSNPNYVELCRRFIADHHDFNQDALKECGIVKYYVNNDLEKCVHHIKEDILAIIK